MKIMSKSEQFGVRFWAKMFRSVASHSGGTLLMPAVTTAKKADNFDPKKFLATIGEGRTEVAFLRKETIFKQGDDADAVFYVRKEKSALLSFPRVARKRPSAY